MKSGFDGLRITGMVHCDVGEGAETREGDWRRRFIKSREGEDGRRGEPNAGIMGGCWRMCTQRMGPGINVLAKAERRVCHVPGCARLKKPLRGQSVAILSRRKASGLT